MSDTPDRGRVIADVDGWVWLTPERPTIPQRWVDADSWRPARPGDLIEAPTNCPDCDGPSLSGGLTWPEALDRCKGKGLVVRAWNITSQPEPAWNEPPQATDTAVDGWRTAVEEAPGD